MSRHDDAAATTANRDWSGAQADDRPRSASVVQSVRFSRDLTERLLTEAERRGTTPSEVIRDLVEAGLAAVEQSATVRLVDVQRAINALVHRAA